MQLLSEGFDEATYLRLNLDVASAVKAGTIPSGWVHWMLHGFDENRPGSPVIDDSTLARFLSIRDSGSPLPPAQLRARVHGDDDSQAFTRAGKRIALDIDQAMKRAGIDFPQARVLDFGCGCGRVLSWFRHLRPGAEFFGCDIDPEPIDWCKVHMPFAAFARNDKAPPLPFPDAHFDFIFSVSVWTHLPEDMQFDWLAEMRRIAKPGSHLALTIAGPYAFERAVKDATPQEADEFGRRGFVYFENTHTDGLPDFYKATFHNHEYVRSRWSGYLEIETIMDRAINCHQDLVICRRP